MALPEAAVGQLDRAVAAILKRTELLPGFNPGAMAEAAIQTREHFRSGNHPEAIESKKDLDLSLYNQFGLDPIVAQRVATHEIEAWTAKKDELRQLHFTSAYSLLNVATRLHFHPPFVAQLAAEDNNREAKAEPHAMLLTQIFSLPNEVKDELIEISEIYFEARRDAAGAFAFKDIDPWMSQNQRNLAKAEFTDYYQRLGAVIGLVNGQAA